MESTTAGHEYLICGDAVAENLTVTITETGAPATLTSYAYQVEEVVNNLDVNGNPTVVTPATAVR